MSDSVGYAGYANMLAKNEPIEETHYNGLRLGILFPVSLLYNIFGVNEFSSNILILLISLSSIILIYKFGKLLFNDKVGLLSAFLLSFFPWDVVYATQLLTDLPAAFFVAVSIYFFLKSEMIRDSAKSNIYCLFSGLWLGIAFLTKELYLIIGLFFISYILYKKKIKIKYFWIALGFILIFSFELIFFFNTTGDPFYKYSAISAYWTPVLSVTNHYVREDFPSALFHYFYLIFTDDFLVIFYSLIFIAIVYCIVNKKKETYTLLFWFIPVFFYLNFGSISIAKYILIPASPRHLFILSIPAILLLSFFLLQRDQIIKRILMPSMLILLLTTSVGNVYVSEFRFSVDDEKEAYNYLKTLPNKQIYTDYKTIRIFNYLSGFKSNNTKSFHNYEFLDPENTYALNLSKAKDSYVVINWNLINFFVSSKKGIELPDEIYNIPENWILKKEIGKGKDKIMIYYASN